MITKIKWQVTSVFFDDVNTDDIIRADVLQESTDKTFFAKYAFEKFDWKFIERCVKQKSNIIVAWENFGCWSSREQAVYAMSWNNVKAVISKSFPDIFYRNSINNWLVLIKFDDIRLLSLWSDVEVDLKNQKIIVQKWKSKKQEYSFDCDSDDLLLMRSWWRLGIVKEYKKSKKVYVNHALVKDFDEQEGPQTIVEKIVSKQVWKKVLAWDKISALGLDFVYLNEVIAPASIRYFWEDFSLQAKVFDPSKINFIPDHSVPSCSIEVSNGIDSMKDFASKHWIFMHKQWRGIEHIVFIEEWKVLPWNIIVGTDSHTCTN